MDFSGSGLLFPLSVTPSLKWRTTEKSHDPKWCVIKTIPENFRIHLKIVSGSQRDSWVPSTKEHQHASLKSNYNQTIRLASNVIYSLEYFYPSYPFFNWSGGKTFFLIETASFFLFCCVPHISIYSFQGGNYSIALEVYNDIQGWIESPFYEIYVDPFIPIVNLMVSPSNLYINL